MCDQSMPYTPGTYVWVKIDSSVWWPGRVVDIPTTPEEIQNCVKQKKNCLAMVYFESDKNYLAVVNLNNICFYSGPKKMDFVEKGYSLFLKQEKKGKKFNFDMKTFITDVEEIERKIGGDINIFMQFEKKNEIIPSPINVNEVFVSAKDLKKKKKKEMKKSTSKPLVSRQQWTKKSLHTSNYRDFSGNRYNYPCHFKKGCKFATNKYDILKRHMAIHINENYTETETNAILTNETISSKTTSCTKASSEAPKQQEVKQEVIKKIKLLDELLKDWDDGSDNDNPIANV